MQIAKFAEFIAPLPIEIKQCVLGPFCKGIWNICKTWALIALKQSNHKCWLINDWIRVCARYALHALRKDNCMMRFLAVFAGHTSRNHSTHSLHLISLCTYGTRFNGLRNCLSLYFFQADHALYTPDLDENRVSWWIVPDIRICSKMIKILLQVHVQKGLFVNLIVETIVL